MNNEVKKALETIDLQRKIRQEIFAYIACLNKIRGWAKPVYTHQISTVYNRIYKELSKRHPAIKWLQHDERPVWISKLDYIAARGGKKMLKEMLAILQELKRTTNEPL